jgi:hypothetical protein
MHWVAMTIILLGVVIRCATGRRLAAARKGGSHRPGSVTKAPDTRQIEELLRDGGYAQWVALASQPLASAHGKRVLEKIVTHAYRERYDPQMHAAVRAYGPVLIDLVQRAETRVKSATGAQTVQCPCFKQLAIALEENGSYAEAIAVCEKALRLGIAEGTQKGFQGRIDRLQKKCMLASQGDRGA